MPAYGSRQALQDGRSEWRFPWSSRPGCREDGRRYPRVRVNLLGRYMLTDRHEYPCQVTDMSQGGMMIAAPVIGQINERVIAYVDHVGRLEGVITRQLENGFAIEYLRLQHPDFIEDNVTGG